MSFFGRRGGGGGDSSAASSRGTSSKTVTTRLHPSRNVPDRLQRTRHALQTKTLPYEPWDRFHETRTLFENNFQIHFRQPLETVDKSRNSDDNCWNSVVEMAQPPLHPERPKSRHVNRCSRCQNCSRQKLTQNRHPG